MNLSFLTLYYLSSSSFFFGAKKSDKTAFISWPLMNKNQVALVCFTEGTWTGCNCGVTYVMEMLLSEGSFEWEITYQAAGAEGGGRKQACCTRLDYDLIIISWV